MYLLMLIGVSFFAVGCGGDSSSDPEEGSEADEKAIDDDLGMQDELMGEDGIEEDGDDSGAP
jgi:hypothetical protein